ncbi:MAG: hypothetical protein RLZZ546_2238 [Bacteroidota bacterium]|jgi:putative membrane protein insertion efficiency factor
MIDKIKFFFCLAILAITLNASSQNHADLIFVKSLLKEQHKENSFMTFKSQLKNNTNELEWIFSGLFFIYKEMFSSQDAGRCSFHPSCSLYGIEAIKSKGLIKGGIMTFDRLTRCNGFSPENYQIDLKKRVFIDPIKW